jgi:hypothetical protein
MRGFGGGGPGAGYTPQPTGPFSIPVQDVRAEYERSTEDSAGNNAYFVRDKVTNGTIIAGNGAAALLGTVYDFKSRYRVVNTTGYVTETGAASAAKPGAYVALMIPNQGGGLRRINQTWQTKTPVLLEWATMDMPPYVLATNRLVGLEWQNGYQTARIEQTYDGKVNMPIFGGAGTMQGANLKMNRTIWFAYKAGKIIRMETTVDLEGQAPANVLSAMVPGAGVGAGIGGIGGGMAGGMAGGYPGGGYRGGAPGFSGAQGGFPGAGGYPGAPAGLGGMGGFGGPGMAGGAGTGGGFGALQQQAEVPLVPAKFRSVTTVTIQRPGTPVRLASAR